MLDWSDREIKKHKPGAIPSHLKPIFDRLEIDRDLWVDALKNYKNWFQHIVGDVEKVWELISGIANHHFKGGKKTANYLINNTSKQKYLNPTKLSWSPCLVFHNLINNY
ncbi:MAG: hypothetical protein COA79_17955 [Planctomycetota bacterium]|nr:MAG: hypothetical protein COA79_17955 [Planctomycetota bacterium]